MPAPNLIFSSFALTAAVLPGALAHAAAPAALESADGMVVTAQHLASDVGAAVLRPGGNAVDAAGALGYPLAPTHPLLGNAARRAFHALPPAHPANTFH